MREIARDRAKAALGTLLFLFVAPGVVAGLAPWWISGWTLRPPFLSFPQLRGIGTILIAAGVLTILESFARFALSGLGTPAPVYPTRRLVVTGLYRHVRNPMYLGVVTSILGQAVLLGDARLLVYAAVVWTAVHIFVLAYEEPTLRRTYGAEYEAYCGHVKRWRPRLLPWRAGGDGSPSAGPA